ncbi:MAG: histidine phosphatase family protein [Candidatus Saccharimonadales bacterium]
MSRFETRSSLRNHYYGMRHGESRANFAGIIVSAPENGVREGYGLTEKGIYQACTAATESTLNADTIIYSSDFSRARHTADVVSGMIGADAINLDIALRERFFGQHELKSSALYQQVWSADEQDPTHCNDRVESVQSVLGRVGCFIDQLESIHQNQTILLVSHGDTLQIAQAGFENVDQRNHRQLQHFDNGEIRTLQLK